MTTQPIRVLAQSGDDLLVRYGERQGMPDAPELALISMNDFIQSVPNDRAVTDRVMQ